MTCPLPGWTTIVETQQVGGTGSTAGSHRWRRSRRRAGRGTGIRSRRCRPSRSRRRNTPCRCSRRWHRHSSSHRIPGSQRARLRIERGDAEPGLPADLGEVAADVDRGTVGRVGVPPLRVERRRPRRDQVPLVRVKARISIAASRSPARRAGGRSCENWPVVYTRFPTMSVSHTTPLICTVGRVWPTRSPVTDPSVRCRRRRGVGVEGRGDDPEVRADEQRREPNTPRL